MTIKYKSTSSDEFISYQSIGSMAYVPGSSPEEFYSLLPGYNKTTLPEWYAKFERMSEGEQIDIINYIFKEAHESYPEITKKLRQEEQRLKDFLSRYFDGSMFDGGLEFIGLDESDGWVIVNEVYNDNEERIEINFEDGSVVRFIDEDEYINYSRFIPETDYDSFVSAVKFFVNLIIEYENTNYK